jgi:DNA repair exonuclease SbcCD ATPase subunit
MLFMAMTRTHKKSVLLALALLFSASCASALKKKCEGTNWFEYGEGVAKHGQRPASDSFVLQCEKEEAKIDHSAMSQGFQKGLDEYCNPDFAYRLGKQGEFLSGDMCSSSMELQMEPKHETGVREYCQPTNGESAGAVGRKYNQICPKELEAAFLPEFGKGRKKYLTGLIARKEGEVRDLDREIENLERRKQPIREDIQRLEWDRTRLRSLVPANSTSNTTNNAAAQELNQVDSRIRSLQWDAGRLDQQISEIQRKQRALREEAREAQGELPTL